MTDPFFGYATLSTSRSRQPRMANVSTLGLFPPASNHVGSPESANTAAAIQHQTNGQPASIDITVNRWSTGQAARPR